MKRSQKMENAVVNEMINTIRSIALEEIPRYNATPDYDPMVGMELRKKLNGFIITFALGAEIDERGRMDIKYPIPTDRQIREVCEIMDVFVNRVETVVRGTDPDDIESFPVTGANIRYPEKINRKTLTAFFNSNPGPFTENIGPDDVVDLVEFGKRIRHHHLIRNIAIISIVSVAVLTATAIIMWKIKKRAEDEISAQDDVGDIDTSDIDVGDIDDADITIDDVSDEVAEVPIDI